MELRAEHISKKFFRRTDSANYFYTLRETDFTLPEKAVTMVMGRSGSGKTTLLNILGGLLRPSEGRVLLDGKDLYAYGDGELSRLRNRYFSVIPQGSSGIYSLNVLDNILLPTLLYHHRDRETVRRAEELMERLDIASLRYAMPAELSGGEMRRMAIARALVTKPAFVLADEPTGDLDDENTETVLRLLRETAEEGASVLLVTHETEAVNYAKEVYRMNGGTLKKTADRRDPAGNAEETAEKLGKANFF